MENGMCVHMDTTTVNKPGASAGWEKNALKGSRNRRSELFDFQHNGWMVDFLKKIDGTIGSTGWHKTNDQNQLFVLFDHYLND